MARLTASILLGLAIAAPAAAAPLTVPMGESWAFRVERGEAARAHRIAPQAAPAKGEIKVSVSKLMGTTMIVTNGTSQRYTFVAELVGVPANKAKPRTCTLPPRLPTLESWPVKSTAVRLSRFRVATGGSC